jgi:ureidoacrylate peracid hydrolase
MDTHHDTRFQLNALPEPLFIDSARTAVIVVDMQNAFVKQGGYFDAVGVDVSRTQKIIPACRRIIDCARENGATVLYLQMTEASDSKNSSDSSTPRFAKQKKKRDLLARRPELLETYYREGTWGHRMIDELLPCDGDPIVEKYRHDGFADTNLNAVLKSLHIECLLFIGTATNICIESTLRHAFFLDYFAVIVSDAVSPMGSDMLQEATFANVQSTFGWIVSSKDLLSGWHRLAPTIPSCLRNQGKF